MHETRGEDPDKAESLCGKGYLVEKDKDDAKRVSLTCDGLWLRDLGFAGARSESNTLCHPVTSGI